MIISHKFKFIFIKTEKTAGTSIEVFLSTVCGQDDIVTPIIPHVDPHMARNYKGYCSHIPGYAIRTQLDSNTWDSYFKFCVERNPWDKTLSHYYMYKARWNNDLTFDKYLENQSFPINFPKYTEPSNTGVIIVNEVLFYESLSSDLARVFARLNIPFSGALGVTAKSEYRTDRRHYRDVYTPEQAALVKDAFSQEIFLHNYSF